MGLFAEGRRVLAEQMETLEDIAAEARARRADIVAAAGNGHLDVEAEQESTEAGPDEAAPRARRRVTTSNRRRTL
jgi:hypothetical protein